jgi:2-polyprenyl-3-methyl-5-hydroxy-6-metoxy-1,4-benzoquinol methylase
VGGVQNKSELEDFYAEEDPWAYDTTRDDAQRVARVLAALPTRPYERTLDIGCGNGFLTVRLPGAQVVGADVSTRGVEWARRRATRTVPDRDVSFVDRSLFELRPADLGTFDLVVVTEVLYPQHIGGAAAVVTEVLRALLRPRAVLLTVHIDTWCSYRAPFTSLTVSVDPYREHFHRLELFQR